MPWFVSMIPFCGIPVVVSLMTQAQYLAVSFVFSAADSLSTMDHPIRLSIRFTSEVVTLSGKEAL